MFTFKSVISRLLLFPIFSRTKMKSTIACLLVLAVAAQAKFYGYGLGGYGDLRDGGYGRGGYGRGGFGLESYGVLRDGGYGRGGYGRGGYGLGGYGVLRDGGYGLEYLDTEIPAIVPDAYPAVQARDELGQASFGYAHPGQAATNLRDGFGNQIGSYAYINPEGKEVRVSYTADSRGFRVLSNDLPVAPVANLVAPVQVEDTPEVAKAKADHAAAVTAAAKSATQSVRATR